MSRSEWVDFRALKSSVRVQAVLDWYQIGGLKRSGIGQLRGRCPLHGRGAEDAFHVSLVKNAFRCFYCQAQGNILDLVAALENCSVRQAAQLLQERFGGGGGGGCWSVGAAVGPATQLVPKKINGNPPLRFRLRGVDPAHSYLPQRGIRLPTAQLFGVGFYAGQGLMSGRLVIPLHDEEGCLVAYCGRCLDGTPPRYKLPAGFRKSLLLFNLHRAARVGRSVVVVEGFFDCMRVHQAGFPGVVALMGSTLSQRQELLLLQSFERVVLLLDGDSAGEQGSAAIAARLAGQCSLTVLHLPAHGQPDQLSDEQICRLLKPLALLPNTRQNI